MNKIKFFIAVFAVALLVSCKDEDKSFGIETYSYRDNYESNALTFSFEYSIDLPSGNTNQEKLIRDKVVERYIGKDYVDLKNSRILSTYFRQWRDQLIQDAASGAEAFDDEEFIYVAEYEVKANIYTEVIGDELITYYKEEYQYLGGAHGMSGKTCETYSIEDGSTLKFDEIFSKTSRRALEEVFHKCLAKEVAVQGYTLYDEVENVEMTDHVCVTKNGILFVYNAYEIAPYSEGIIQVELPKEELRNLIDSQSAVYKFFYGNYSEGIIQVELLKEELRNLIDSQSAVYKFFYGN